MTTALLVLSQQQSERLIHRYQDAYRVAFGTKTLGDAIKFLSVVLAVIIAVIAFVPIMNGGEVGVLQITGIGAAILVGVFGFAVGVLIAAQGQLMQAVVDTAVNTSPLLSEEQKMPMLQI